MMKRYIVFCFSPEKHRLLFSDITKDSASSGIEIKQFRSNNNKNIFVNDFTSVKKVKFGKKTLQANIFTIKQMINECAIFDIVDVTGFIYNLQPKETHKNSAH